jgi:hypothetical protein
MPIKSLKRLRWAVRIVLALGVAASIAANILHARPNPISQTISAWPPVALLLTVELVSRIPVGRIWLAIIRISATATIAGIAGWVSYWHMASVASHYGESDTSAYLLPFTVDGLIVVASVCLVELSARLRAVDERVTPAPTVQAQRVVDQVVSAMPVPVSPAPVEAGVRATQSSRSVRSGPVVTGPSKESPLTGRVLMEEPPKA